MTDTMIAPDAPPWQENGQVEELEQRVQRLEEVVSSLCDTKGLEERLQAKVMEQLKAEPVVAAPLVAPPAVLVATPISSDESKPTGPGAPPLALSLAARSVLSLFRDVWSDLRTILLMIKDPGYRMSWAAIVIPLLALAYVLCPQQIKFGPFDLISNNFPILGALDELIIAYIGFKVMGRELRRYREFVASAYGRAHGSFRR